MRVVELRYFHALPKRVTDIVVDGKRRLELDKAGADVANVDEADLVASRAAGD